MNPLCLLILFSFATAKCFSQKITILPNYSVIDSVTGDLDKDGVDELVVAFNTLDDTSQWGDGVPRELIIYKKMDTGWTVWQRSMQALYDSRGGGMMGDPFGGIAVAKGVLHVSQNGGSSWKWSHTDKYRFDGTVFRLIGYESNYGKPCEYWETVDFNLVTGKLIVDKAYEHCGTDSQEVYKRQNETFYKKNINITLQHRSDRELKIVSPRYQHEIYVASKVQ